MSAAINKQKAKAVCFSRIEDTSPRKHVYIVQTVRADIHRLNEPFLYHFGLSNFTNTKVLAFKNTIKYNFYQMRTG